MALLRCSFLVCKMGHPGVCLVNVGKEPLYVWHIRPFPPVKKVHEKGWKTHVEEGNFQDSQVS